MRKAVSSSEEYLMGQKYPHMITKAHLNKDNPNK